MNIILADDSKILRQRIISLLEEIKGVKVIAEAENSKEALQYIEDLSPDLIVLDLRMPGGGGLEVLERMKEKSQPVIIMVLTNYPTDQYRRKCLEFGADYFFDKSTEFEQMYETVKELSAKNKFKERRN